MWTVLKKKLFRYFLRTTRKASLKKRASVMGFCNRGERLDSILNIGWGGSVDGILLRGKGDSC